MFVSWKWTREWLWSGCFSGFIVCHFCCQSCSRRMMDKIMHTGTYTKWPVLMHAHTSAQHTCKHTLPLHTPHTCTHTCTRVCFKTCTHRKVNRFVFLVSIIFCIRTKPVHKVFYGKCNGIFRACVNREYQASPWGGLGTRLVCVCMAYVWVLCVLCVLCVVGVYACVLCRCVHAWVQVLLRIYWYALFYPSFVLNTIVSSGVRIK